MPRIRSSDYRIQEVLHCLERHPVKTVEELAGLVSLSGSRLGHLFKAEVGVSLDSFLTKVRVDKGAQLLKDTHMQVKEIAATVGYRQAPSFDRAFKNKFKISPAGYRRLKRL